MRPTGQAGTRRHRRAARALATAALGFVPGVLLAGCSAGSSIFNGPPAQFVGAPVTYLDVLDPSTLPSSGQPNFPTVLLGDALPPWTTFYDASPTGPALSLPSTGLAQVAQVARLEAPTFVTVSYGMTAALDGVPSGQFAAALGQLLARLQSQRTSTVLVANLIPINVTPDAVGSGGAAALISAYNDAISTEASAHGAIVVNLHQALAAAVHVHGAGAVFAPSTGELTSLGMHLVDEAFLQAVRHRPINRAGTRAT